MNFGYGPRTFLALAGTLALCGCVGSLLGGGEPDALYRFGTTATATSARQLVTPRRMIAMPPPQFAPAIGGDRILTSQGSEASYIKDMRWVTSAPALYAASIEATVSERVPDMAVMSRGGFRRSDAVLVVSVERFEATYPTAGAALPTVNVEGHATLSSQSEKRILGRYQFASAYTASSNTGPGIAAAFDAAAKESVVQIVDWANVTTPVPRDPKN